MKCNKKLMTAVAVLLLSVPMASFAEEGKKLNPWTKCGIGAMIFDETAWAAAISNIIWDYGITATTSAASSDHTCEGKDVVAARFINDSYANLEEETVKGDGKHIHAMLDILGCNRESHEKIVNKVRADFGALIQDQSYYQRTSTEKAESYYHMVQERVGGDFASSCQAI